MANHANPFIKSAIEKIHCWLVRDFLRSMNKNSSLKHSGYLIGWFLFAVLHMIPVSLSGQNLTKPCMQAENCLVSFTVDKQIMFLSSLSSAEMVMYPDLGLKVSYRVDSVSSELTRYQVLFENLSTDTLIIENVVPYGECDDNVYITASGPWDLARARLFRPGKSPVGVILPDNAWEMGFGTDGRRMAIARRTHWEKAQRKRYETHLFPDGNVRYTLWERKAKTTWQESLRQFCQIDYLFDLNNFNDSLYRRADLAWIRKAYLIQLQFAWDREFIDVASGTYRLGDFLREKRSLIGHYDIFGIWPTWPRLGLDERNQWDMYRDLPGGLPALKQLADTSRSLGTRFFIAWNPWDQSTRAEDQLQGMASLIKAMDADGVVLDTKGSSSLELQRSADSVRSGVVMYSEGMAVVKDMPGIISGRVHDAIFMPPPLNLNKFIRPDFSIFRVCQLSQGHIHREAAISLFNGYGLEINTFAPGRPDWTNTELAYLGRVLRLLRENHSNFQASNWLPLLPVEADSTWVNLFPRPEKDIYTVLSLNPQGLESPLIPVTVQSGSHYVSLWHHEELEAFAHDSGFLLPVTLEPYLRSWRNTRREGSVDVVARLPELLKVSITADSLFIEQPDADTVKIWFEDPGYDKLPAAIANSNQHIHIPTTFGDYEGKVVIQLFHEGELADERVVRLGVAIARKISPFGESSTTGDRNDMVRIPAGDFVLHASNPDAFIPYPPDSALVHLESYLIDVYPVTNRQFGRFLQSTGYQPADTVNFLKHWSSGHCPDSLQNHPVVWVSVADARAYARWAGKRLPTEAEWQHAAQGADGTEWPWGVEFDSTRCNTTGLNTLPVDYFGEKGQSGAGLRDLVGNIWQIMADQYDNGAYRFTILKGGCYWHPTSSWWYVQGGARPINHRQMWLHVSDGFDRSATVGFRCVMDVNDK
ncbi:MAG: sulfatase-modifying factor protein [Bacteroidetes bacterium]|nr:MAG: sulfatase-modifying factor protein [Bacteroidota bacterium]